MSINEKLGPLESELNRGFLQVLALAALEKPMYGYRMLKIFELNGYAVEENTLYPLLRRLEKNELIQSRWELEGERPRKIYVITRHGRRVRNLLLEIRRRQEEALIKFLKGEQSE